MLELPVACPRRFESCSPLATTSTDSGFVCVGLHGDPTGPGEPFRECIRSRPGVDHMADCSMGDLTDLVDVVRRAMVVLADRELDPQS